MATEDRMSGEEVVQAWDDVNDAYAYAETKAAEKAAEDNEENNP